MGIFSRSTPDFEAIRADLQDQSRRVRDLLAEVDGLKTEIHTRFRELEERTDSQARQVRLMAEEMEERIDRGNKVWRKIRASEYYEAQRQDREEDEDPSFDFYSGDGEGGNGEELPPLHQNVGRLGRPPSKAAALGKDLARRIAGIQ